MITDENRDSQMYRSALIALDPTALAAAAGFDLDDWQRDYLLRRPQRGLLVISRQGGKTTVAGIDAAHELVYRHGRDILVLAPTQRQSSEFVRRTRQVLRRLPDPPKLATDATFTIEVAHTGSRIVALPGADPDNVRGYSPNVVYLDEAARVDEDLLVAARPMLAATGGRMVCLSTPNGRSGNWFADLWFGDGEWYRVCVPATDVPRISAEFLEQERREVTDRAFRAEYLCEFLDAQDAVFSADLIRAAFDESEPIWTPPAL